MQAAQQISKFKPRIERNATMESVCVLGLMCSEAFHSYSEIGRYSRLYSKETVLWGQQETFVRVYFTHNTHSHTPLSPVGEPQCLLKWKAQLLLDLEYGGETSHITYVHRASSPYKTTTCSCPSRIATFVVHATCKPLAFHLTWQPLA